MVRRTVLLAILSLAGCAPQGSGGAPATGTGTETVMLTATHRSEWRVLWIEGETDLPDGAEVAIRTTHEQGRMLSEDEWPAFNMIETSRATVEGGQYWVQVNTQGWPRGEVEVVAQFPLPPQPADVIARYGQFGESLTGANVTDLGGGVKAVEVVHTFEHTP